MKLALEGIGHSYLGRSVFERVDLALEHGEIVAVLGPSGCGKTTLLQIAAGLIEPMRGAVRRGYRKHAVVFQEPRLLPWMTTQDNIAYGLQVDGADPQAYRRASQHRAREVGLYPHDLEKYPMELSGGMRQRASVARALAVEPDVIFFDEPFTAVDVGLKRVLQDLVIGAASREHFAALFVTHDLTEAIRMSHRMVLLSGRGKGIVVHRAIKGEPGTRSDRDIFEMATECASDPAFAELFDADRERVS